MPVHPTHRFTVDEYYRMAEAGVIKPSARVELLDGRIVDMMPIGPFHGGVTNRLNRFFTQVGGERWTVCTQNPVRLNEHSEPQPDIMLVKPRVDDYTTAHPTPDDVLLLIEVADSSLSIDREDKLPLYGRAGIAEVWLINLPERKVEVYREPHYVGYGSTTILGPGDTATLLAFPDIAVSIAELLR